MNTPYDGAPRALQATYDPLAPYTVEREDGDSGEISYLIFDSRPATYRLVCAVDDYLNRNARRDAEYIARGLNALVKLGIES